MTLISGDIGVQENYFDQIIFANTERFRKIVPSNFGSKISINTKLY